MVETTLTRADLADAINRSVGLSRADSSRMVESIIDMITDSLADGNQVKLTGFGTFTLRDKNERMGRNPKTGDAVPITPRRVLGFRPAQMVRTRIAGQ
jgi:integration host factor subunit alpha